MTTTREELHCGNCYWHMSSAAHTPGTLEHPDTPVRPNRLKDKVRVRVSFIVEVSREAYVMNYDVYLTDRIREMAQQDAYNAALEHFQRTDVLHPDFVPE